LGVFKGLNEVSLECYITPLHHAYNLFFKKIGFL